MFLHYFIFDEFGITSVFLILIHAQLIIVSLITLISIPLVYRAYEKLFKYSGDDNIYRSKRIKAGFVILHFCHYFRAWGTYLQVLEALKWLFSNK
jgi:hypothetical protein